MTDKVAQRRHPEILRSAQDDSCEEGRECARSAQADMDTLRFVSF